MMCILDNNVGIKWSSGYGPQTKIIRFTDHKSIEKTRKIISDNKYKKYKITLHKLDSPDVDEKIAKGFGYIGEYISQEFKINKNNPNCPFKKLLKKYLVSKKVCKTHLLIINGCHSYALAQLFVPYIKYVIYTIRFN